MEQAEKVKFPGIWDRERGGRVFTMVGLARRTVLGPRPNYNEYKENTICRLMVDRILKLYVVLLVGVIGN